MILSPTSIEIADTTAAATQDRASVASYAKAVLVELRRAITANAAYEDLARRSDAALSDVGLTRTHVARQVYDAHYID